MAVVVATVAKSFGQNLLSGITTLVTGGKLSAPQKMALGIIGVPLATILFIAGLGMTALASTPSVLSYPGCDSDGNISQASGDGTTLNAGADEAGIPPTQWRKYSPYQGKQYKDVEIPGPSSRIVMPVKFSGSLTSNISSNFGWRTLDKGPEFHTGIDIAVPSGTPYVAVADGVVVEAKEGPGCGGRILTKHKDEKGDVFFTRACHIKAFSKKAGDRVKAGDQLGVTGGAAGDPMKGRSFGAHLHFEIALGHSANITEPKAWLEQHNAEGAGGVIDPATGQALSVASSENQSCCGSNTSSPALNTNNSGGGSGRGGSRNYNVSPPPITATGVMKEVVEFAYSKKGKPYIYGAVGPSGYDCSGIVSAAYNRADGKRLWSTYTMKNLGTNIDLSQAQQGDVFLCPGHTGFFMGRAGDGIPIWFHAPRPGKVLEFFSSDRPCGKKSFVIKRVDPVKDVPGGGGSTGGAGGNNASAYQQCPASTTGALLKTTQCKDPSIGPNNLPSPQKMRSMGVFRDEKYKYTYYSQRVLPGGGLKIPGRHVCKGHFVCDNEENIVIAPSVQGGFKKGDVLESACFGKMKAYDVCGENNNGTKCDPEIVDIYVDL